MTNRSLPHTTTLSFTRRATMTPERARLIESSQGLVRSIAWKIHLKVGKRVPLDDLINEGQVGLLEAVNAYDSSRSNQFTTYAYYRIRGSILDSLARQSWFSQSDYHGSRYEQAANDYLAVDRELSGQSEKAIEWFDRACGTLAISYMLSSDATAAIAHTLEGTERDPADEVMSTELRSKLHAAIDELPADAAVLIKATYFEGLTIKAAGERLGISKSWASRLHHQTLTKLAALLGD